MFVYLFFGSSGRFRFGHQWTNALYPALGEAFLAGQLHLVQSPDPRLAVLEDPWKPEQREGIEYLWDASYFDGRYYVYFSPVPVLLFYIPFHFVTGRFPTEQLAGTLFSVVAFLLWTATLRRTLRGGSIVPLPLWILFCGLAFLVPYVLVNQAVYEVAITCAMAMSAAWGYSLLRFLEAPSARWGFLAGLALSLAIASRPLLIVLLIPTAIAALRRPGRRRVALLAASALPFLAVGGAYAAYNHARFGSVSEVGQSYQLTAMSQRDVSFCGVGSLAECIRLSDRMKHHLFWLPQLRDGFPFIDLRIHRLDPPVTDRLAPEPVGGVLPFVPLAVAGAAAAAILLASRRAVDAAAEVSVVLVAGGVTVLLTLSSCLWVTVRYQLDYLPILGIGAVIAVEGWLALTRGTARQALRAAVIAALLWSVLAGVLLGFSGRDDSFAKRNPRLFRAVASVFG